MPLVALRSHMVNNKNCIFTLLIVKGIKPTLILATFFVLYRCHTKKSYVWRDKCSQGFPTSAYYCIPLQPPYTSTIPNHLLIMVNIKKIPMNSWAHWLKKKIRMYNGQRNVKYQEKCGGWWVMGLTCTFMASV